MALNVAVGVSSNVELVSAAESAARSARESCAEPTLVLVFPTFTYGDAALKDAIAAVAKVFPSARIAGGQVVGWLYEDVRHDAMYTGRAVAVVAIAGARVGAALVADPRREPVAAGRAIAEAARADLGGDLVGGFLLTPGVTAAPFLIDAELLRGVGEIAPKLRLSGGGLTGGMNDDGHSLPGRAFLDGRIEEAGALLVVFGDNVRTSFAVANGFQSLGRSARVTAADGPFLRSIDGRTSRDAVLDLLVGADEAARETYLRSPLIWSVENATTLAVKDPSNERFWVHGATGYTPEGAAVDFWRAREGDTLHVIRIDKQECRDAVKLACEMLADDAGSPELDFVLSFSCALRGFTLGGEVANEDAELRSYLRARRRFTIVASGEIGCVGEGAPFSTGWSYSLFGLAER